MEQQKKQTIKYRLIAHVVQLNLNKNLNFETKVSWKRNVNKAETETVTHRNCCSVFDERLQLEINLLYNHAQSRFEPKLTEFAVVVIYQGKIKSGGHVKYDAAEIVNNNYNNERVNLSLSQCPDPNATLEIIFDYEIITESHRSLFNELSMINPSNQSNLSQINFPEELEQHGQNNTDLVPVDPIHLTQKPNTKGSSFRQKEVSKINTILDKFQAISKKIKPSPQSLSDDQNTAKSESLQISARLMANQQRLMANQQRLMASEQRLMASEQRLMASEQRLKAQITQLQNELELKSCLIAEYERKLEEAGRKIQQQDKRMQQEHIRLQAAEQKINELSSARESAKISDALIQSQRKYRELYQQAQRELEQARDTMSAELNFSKNHHFKKFVEEVRSVEEVPQFEHHFKPNHDQSTLKEQICRLQRESIDLQTKVAEMSHNIAQLFNAAYDYGGAKLLDYLQGSIGLTEQYS